MRRLAAVGLTATRSQLPASVPRDALRDPFHGMRQNRAGNLTRLAV